jgi:hypothetical protein
MAVCRQSQGRGTMPGPGGCWCAGRTRFLVSKVSSSLECHGIRPGAIKTESARRSSWPADRGDALGVDENAWSPTGLLRSGTTAAVDHTRDASGVMHARLLVLSFGPIRERLRRLAQERGEDLTAAVKTAALYPFRGYARTPLGATAINRSRPTCCFFRSWKQCIASSAVSPALLV